MCDFSVDLNTYNNWLKKRIVRPLEPKQFLIEQKIKSKEEKLLKEKRKKEQLEE